MQNFSISRMKRLSDDNDDRLTASRDLLRYFSAFFSVILSSKYRVRSSKEADMASMSARGPLTISSLLLIEGRHKEVMRGRITSRLYRSPKS